MAAPEYVPKPPVERRRGYGSPDYVPGRWVPDRPGDLDVGQPVGRAFGRPGPDQGYALVLANRFRDRLALAPGEDADDVVWGCLGIALRRASMYGRAPVIHDLELAFTIWGLLGEAPPELVELRRHTLQGAGNPHHYLEGRAVTDRVPEATMRMTPAQAREAFARGEWRSLLGV